MAKVMLSRPTRLGSCFFAAADMFVVFGCFFGCLLFWKWILDFWLLFAEDGWGGLGFVFVVGGTGPVGFLCLDFGDILVCTEFI